VLALFRNIVDEDLDVLDIAGEPSLRSMLAGRLLV
jgi:hypothetical protein